VQGGRNRHGGQGTRQFIVPLTLFDQARFEDHLGQLFDKQRHPIGSGYQLPMHLGGQRLATREVRHHCLHLRVR
jgi:hypothetical protein